MTMVSETCPLLAALTISMVRENHMSTQGPSVLSDMLHNGKAQRQHELRAAASEGDIAWNSGRFDRRTTTICAISCISLPTAAVGEKERLVAEVIGSDRTWHFAEVSRSLIDLWLALIETALIRRYSMRR